jgi:hypothetical protein
MTCLHQWHDATTAAGPEWVCSQCKITYTQTKQAPPAKRGWVGLTDADAQWIYDNARTPSGMIEMTEAKLKEKNT